MLKFFKHYNRDFKGQDQLNIIKITLVLHIQAGFSTILSCNVLECGLMQRVFQVNTCMHGLGFNSRYHWRSKVTPR